MSVQKEYKELEKLANINRDACEFYEEAQKKVESPQLRQTFRDLEDLHKGVVTSIKMRSQKLGGNPDIDTTMTGQAAQFWGELKANFSSHPDVAFVTELEAAEDRCLHKVQDIMNDNEISPATKAVLKKEYESLRNSHAYMKRLKDMMASAA